MLESFNMTHEFFFFLHARIKLYISKLENGIDQKDLATTNLCERKMY